MKGTVAFLAKALATLGAGGSPLIFFSLPSSLITAEKQRKFQWSLSLDLKDEGNMGEAKKGEGYWLENFNKEKWQGIEQKKWEELSGKVERSVYKLAFRSSWIQEEDKNLGEKSAKGALTLIKASWGGDGVSEKKVRAEEIKVGEDRKVWLIIAKGEESIYLIPVVRAANSGGGRRTGLMDGEEDKKIDMEGVKNIKEWTEKFDKEGDWTEENNKCLEKEYETGINITRSSSFVSVGEGKVKELKKDGWDVVYYEDGQERERGWDVYDKRKQEGERFSLNAGKMVGMKFIRECRKGVRNKRYFPLDIMVLGSTRGLKDTTSSTRNLTQRITIEDKITQVIGVRLDQVVISDTGIGGGGKENEIKWGSITKPTLVRKLLK